MIIPAILEKNWKALDRKITISKTFTNTTHIDFIDGKFSSNKSFLEFEKFEKYKGSLNLEAHLMVEEPANYLEKLAEVGFKRFIGHVEEMSNQVEFIAKGERLGSVGLALDLDTPLSSIIVSLDDLDQILLMSVKAGKSGQKFNEGILDKIRDLKSKYLGEIEIDGGINDKTLPLAKKSGASSFCVTSFLFDEDPKKKYELLKSLL